MDDLNAVTRAIIGAAIRIHRDIGPGLLESVYETALAHALARRGHRVARQTAVPFEYDGMVFDAGLRLDLLVDGCVVVELKSVEKLSPVHTRQLLTYLRLFDLRVGLLINFGAPTLREGLHRFVNHLPPSAAPRLRVNEQPEDHRATDGM